MRILKKLFAIALCFVIVLGAVPIMVSADDAYSNVPEMIQSEGTYEIYKGVKYEGKWGSSALDEYYLPGYASTNSIYVSSPKFDTYDYFEFDFYVDDVDNFKTRVSSVQFVAWRTKTKKFEFAQQVVKSGWNHIKIQISYDNEDEKTYLREAQQVRFYITMSDSDIGADDRYRVANICATKDIDTAVPDMTLSDDVFALYEGVKFEGVLGSNGLSGQAHLTGYSSGSPAEIIFNNPTLSDYNSFEFDFFVADISNFNARSTKMYFNMRTNSASKDTVEFTEQITKSGWNRIKIALTLDDSVLDSIVKVRYCMDINAGSTGADDSYKIANICAVKAVDETVPDMTLSDDVFALYEGVKFEGVLGSNGLSGQAHLAGYSSGNPAEVKFTNPGLADYGAFEFDFFVDEIANFNARSTKMYFNMRTNSASKGTVEFTDQITKSGWNHIKITTDLDSSTLNSIVKVRFYMDINVGTTGANDRYKIANICAVQGEVSNLDKPVYNPIVNVGKDQTEIYITWFTENDKPAKLVFDGIEVAPFDSGLSDDGVLYYHRAKVTNLKENTTYTYNVGNSETLSDEFTLKTKGFDDEFSFVHVSDAQLTGSDVYTKNWEKTLSQINANLPDTSFILDTGDIADTTKTELFGYYKSPKLLTGYITSAIHGNHGSTPNSYFSEHFTMPETYEAYSDYARSDCDYWFGYNSVLFISLNTNIEDIDYHKNFIRKTINAQKDNYNWIIVNCHNSLFGASYHRNEGNTTLFRGNLAPFFSEMGVDMVLSGHDHCYDRSYMIEGTAPNVSSESFSANTDGGVLYVSAQSASALKFNNAESGAEEYSAKLVESKFGFISYDVTDAAITLTYYSSADMSVLDKFTLYKDDGKHMVEPEKNLLKDKNLENVQIGSNGKYTVSFDEAVNISSSCSVELDLGLKNNSLTDVTVTLIDANGNVISKKFSDLKIGWNNLSTQISDMSGNADLENIVALEVTGNVGSAFAMANLFVGHIYTDDEDISCETCDNERNPFIDPNKIPQMPHSESVSAIYEGVKYSGTLGNKGLEENYLPGYASTNSIYVSNPEYDTYDYFELDFYVENIDNFKERVSSIQFVAWKTKTKKFEFVNQITKSGWNHIKIKISYDSEDERIYLSEAQQVRFYITMSESNVGAADIYKVANICATMDLSNIVPELNNVYRTMDSIAGLQHSIELSPGENSYSQNKNKHFFKLSKILNTTYAEYIEMDIYVSADVDSGAWLWISDNKQDSLSRGKYALPNDLKAGWNHVVIKAADTLQTVGDFRLKGYGFTLPYLEGAFYSSTHSTGGTVKIANLSITKDIAIPDDTMREHISFIDSELKFTSFDENGVCMLLFNLAKDIANTKMIEVDVFVENGDVETVILEIMDSKGNYSSYEFSGLTAGWNHLAVRISDLTQGEENDNEVDLEDICYFTLFGTAGANIVVANAYAADYLEGDLNRDGLVDLRDLVRAKKMAAGVTDKGNVLSISEDDNVIRANDISKLNVLLLNGVQLGNNTYSSPLAEENKFKVLQTH